MAKTVLTKADLYYVAGLAQQTTGGAFRFEGCGSAIGKGGARYFDGITQQVWLGRNGGRTNVVAYYFGAVMEWVRRTGIDLDDEAASRLLEIRVRSYGAAGDWAHWETEGRSTAYNRWASRNVLAVRNASTGIWFNVVRQGLDTDGDDLISFYDTRVNHTDYGQFTGGRYALERLVKRDRASGLTLYGGEPQWVLDAPAMHKVLTWLDKLVAENLNRNQT